MVFRWEARQSSVISRRSSVASRRSSVDSASTCARRARPDHCVADLILQNTRLAFVIVAAAIVLLGSHPAGQGTVRGDERGRLRVEGKTFRDESGALWMWRGCTDFMAFARFLNGEDIDRLLTERIQVGCRLLRVLGMAHHIPEDLRLPDFTPKTFGERYWSGLSAFADKLAGRGLRFEFVVFADAQLLMPRVADQRAHLARVASTLASKWNVVGELANEWPKNGVDPGRFEKPAGLLWSRGSGLGEQRPFVPVWDWVGHHGDRGDHWFADETARDIRDGLGVPVIQDEPVGAGEAAEPGRRDNVPDRFRWAGALWAFSGGATFHSAAGIASEPYGPVQKTSAVAFFEGLRAIPADAQTWRALTGSQPDMPLVHVNRPDSGGAAHTTCRVGTSSAWCVVSDPRQKWRPTARSGWRVATQAGPRGEIVRLER